MAKNNYLSLNTTVYMTISKSENTQPHQEEIEIHNNSGRKGTFCVF